MMARRLRAEGARAQVERVLGELDAGVHESGDRGGGLEGFRQPAVEGELGGLEEGGGDEKECDGSDVGGGCAGESGCFGEELVELEGSEALPGEEGGGDEAGFGEAADEEFFAGSGDGLAAFGVEGEELV